MTLTAAPAISGRIDFSHALWANTIFLRTMRYVERNPVRASIATLAWEYPWSSAAVHVGQAMPQNFPKDLISTTGFKPSSEAWQAFLRHADDPRDITALRRATQTGRPLAGDRTMSKFEKLVGRRLRALPPGRPRKNTTT
ncbi:MAG: hypothetical protein ACP5QA_15460 [Phycisphaerae bacterium]